MKKKKIILAIAFLLLIGIVIIGLLLFKSINKYSNITSITPSNLEEKINNKETFIVVITQTGCMHCENYLPEFNRTLKELQLEAYQLNVTGLSNEESTILNKYINFSGTPTTIFYRNGEEGTTLTRISGYASSTKIKERLKSLGYIE